MKAIDFKAPQTLEEALAALRGGNGGARPLAGGTDLIVQLREYRRDADVVVDIKRIPELNELTLTDKELVVGAAVPCYRIYEDESISAAYPALFDSASLIGGIQIQSRASFGGNLCNASPAADGIPSLIVHRGVCRVAGADGLREVPVEQFCTAPGKTVLGAGELLVSFAFPRSKGKFGSHYLRFIPRNEMDIAVVGAASYLELEDDGKTIRQAHIAVGAVAPTPLYLEEASAALIGKTAGAEAFEEAAAAASAAAKPITDMRGEVWQRRHLAGVLTRRTLEGALNKAKGA